MRGSLFSRIEQFSDSVSEALWVVLAAIGSSEIVRVPRPVHPSVFTPSPGNGAVDGDGGALQFFPKCSWNRSKLAGGGPHSPPTKNQPHTPPLTLSSMAFFFLVSFLIRSLHFPNLPIKVIILS